MPGPKKGERFGGRKKGTPNKKTVAREDLAKAQILAAMAKAKKAGAPEPKVALTELYKAIAIAEGVAGKLQPRDITRDASGKVSIVGGDIKLFKEWFELWWSIIETLMKYQNPQIKPIDIPAPPPDPKDLEQQSKVRFGLRVFEGGREIDEGSAK